jgi:DNA polymerase III, delta subunit
VADRRIVLIEHADAANEQTQNALLKALEEPTARHMFILVADEPSRLLPTVRSRCQPLRIGRVPRHELVDWLMDRHRVAADQADALARLSGGLTGVALAYVRDPEGIAWQRRAQAELLALLERGLADRFGSVRELLDDAGRQASPVPDEATAGNEEGESPRVITAVQRHGAQRLTAAWLELSRDLLMVSAGRPDLASAAELVHGLPDFARGIGPERWVDFIGLLERIHEGLRESGAPRLAMEVAMLEWPSLASR